MDNIDIVLDGNDIDINNIDNDNILLYLSILLTCSLLWWWDYSFNDGSCDVAAKLPRRNHKAPKEK